MGASCGVITISPGEARVIGTNVPAPPLDAERIGTLPATQRQGWLDYLQRSATQMRADRASLQAELPAGASQPPSPAPHGAGIKSMPMDQDPVWYAGADARRIADNVASFQTPAGGWSKNLDRAGSPRLPGQRYGSDGGPAVPDPTNFDQPDDRRWIYVGTIDNGATTGELRYLARVAAAVPGQEGDAYRASFVSGIRYLLAAQYPNGGWPQVWPLQGGYHDGITFNDNGMAEVMMLLHDVATDPRFAFVPGDMRSQAGAAVERGTAVILQAQVRVDGQRTGWPQQVDPLTLEPISARNYEPRSIASGETTDILLFLMREPRPAAEVRTAIEGGIAWLRSKATHDVAFTRVEGEGRKLIPHPGAGPIWSRNYDVVSGQPIFGDRDKSIHDDVNGISEGRRNGYAWWVNTPQRVLDAYPAWRSRTET
ncbi:pectate lyase [Croceibacterium mercuriale]|uniref:Pectate lyase n=1 Tax=Croceibacterium mercuriale TaxID=1572751 RepID=A0A0B2BZD5_9SPHN|nr:pectate lyase [Croceibacterium mercuriale]